MPMVEVSSAAPAPADEYVAPLIEVFSVAPALVDEYVAPVVEVFSLWHLPSSPWTSTSLRCLWCSLRHLFPWTSTSLL